MIQFTLFMGTIYPLALVALEPGVPPQRLTEIPSRFASQKAQHASKDHGHADTDEGNADGGEGDGRKHNQAKKNETATDGNP